MERARFEADDCIVWLIRPRFQMELGQIPFDLIQRLVADIVTVSEQAIVDAVRYAFFDLKLVVEPSGVLGIAALLSGAVSTTGRVGILINGGNIDSDVMIDCLD